MFEQPDGTEKRLMCFGAFCSAVFGISKIIFKLNGEPDPDNLVRCAALKHHFKLGNHLSLFQNLKKFARNFEFYKFLRN